MKRWGIVVMGMLCSLVLVGEVGAVTSDFTIQTLVGDDVEPPTTPTILSATPVSTSQIDLVWSTSTDNYTLDGYQVFRDVTQIATTTQTSYSDTGLAASTTYSYTVRAFDNFFNFSTSSVAVATTTLAPPATTTPTTTPPTVTDDAGSRAIGGVNLSVPIVIVPERTAAELSWTTPIRTGFQVRWGATSELEAGSVRSEIVRSEQRVRVTDLAPGTTYWYEVILYSGSGREVQRESGTFTTLMGDDTTPPVNVHNFTASVDGDTVRLAWELPDENDIVAVRVVSNYRFFPTSPRDGILVYQGPGTTAVDDNALRSRDVQYYAAFAYDAAGNVSSGALTWAQKPRADGTAFWPTPATSTVVSPGDPAVTSATVQLRDVVVEQGNERYTLDDQFVLRGDQPFTLRIPYAVLPEHLKAIVVSLRHPRVADSVFTFLLRVNADQTFYEAAIAPVGFDGVMPVAVAIYDFKTQAMSVEETLVPVVLPTTAATEEQLYVRVAIAILAALIIVSIGTWWCQRRRRDSSRT